MELMEYPDQEMMMIDLANRLAGELGAALRQDDRVLLCVPGGTTPGPIFDALCDVDLDWARVDVLLTDERWVPEDDPRSNTRLVKRHLLTGRAAAATLVPLHVPGHAPQEVLDDLARAIEPRLPITVALLGMGSDMHTASLFPGGPGLASDDQVLVTVTGVGLPEPRVSLSARVLNGALSKHIVITGAEKRAALDRARRLSDDEAPVAAVLDGAVVHWAE